MYVLYTPSTPEYPVYTDRIVDAIPRYETCIWWNKANEGKSSWRANFCE
jgi:hypothetical protein